MLFFFNSQFVATCFTSELDPINVFSSLTIVVITVPRKHAFMNNQIRKQMLKQTNARIPGQFAELQLELAEQKKQ
jgi:hypothetical protein